MESSISGREGNDGLMNYGSDACVFVSGCVFHAMQHMWDELTGGASREKRLHEVSWYQDCNKGEGQASTRDTVLVRAELER
jgi:hypothetical protein